MNISKFFFDRLNLEDRYEDIVSNYYCSHLTRKNKCPRLHERTCAACVPVLRSLTKGGMESVETKEPLIKWRLKEYGMGRLDVWYSEQKETVRGYHRDVNPLSSPQELIKRLT